MNILGPGAVIHSNGPRTPTLLIVEPGVGFDGLDDLSLSAVVLVSM